MTSERARFANRQNSSKSTGPRTFVGKARSKRNSHKHGLSIFESSHHVGAEIEHLAEFIVGKYSGDPGILDAARNIAVAQIFLEQVQAVRNALLRGGAMDGTSGFESRACLRGKKFSDIIDRLERLDRYEARALSRRKFAVRRFLLLVSSHR
jgi:hypothetical protein